jgi:hypothetical protein
VAGEHGVLVIVFDVKDVQRLFHRSHRKQSAGPALRIEDGIKHTDVRLLWFTNFT